MDLLLATNTNNHHPASKGALWCSEGYLAARFEPVCGAPRLHVSWELWKACWAVRLAFFGLHVHTLSGSFQFKQELCPVWPYQESVRLKSDQGGKSWLPIPKERSHFRSVQRQQGLGRYLEAGNFTSWHIPTRCRHPNTPRPWEAYSSLAEEAKLPCRVFLTVAWQDVANGAPEAKKVSLKHLETPVPTFCTDEMQHFIWIIMNYCQYDRTVGSQRVELCWYTNNTTNNSSIQFNIVQ